MPGVHYLFVDTETTGTDSKAGHVVQIAWILTDENGSALEEASHIIKPNGYSIPWGAARIHGITTERALESGKPIDWALSRLTTAASRASVLVAHNLTFDYGFLCTEYSRCGLPNPLADKVHVCTMRSTTDWCGLPFPSGRRGKKWPKLAELYQKLFNETLNGAHDALVDARAVRKCYFTLVDRGILEDGETNATARGCASAAKPNSQPARLNVYSTPRSSEYVYRGSGGKPEEKTDPYVLTRILCGHVKATNGGILQSPADVEELVPEFVRTLDSDYVDLCRRVIAAVWGLGDLLDREERFRWGGDAEEIIAVMERAACRELGCQYSPDMVYEDDDEDDHKYEYDDEDECEYDDEEEVEDDGNDESEADCRERHSECVDLNTEEHLVSPVVTNSHPHVSTPGEADRGRVAYCKGDRVVHPSMPSWGEGEVQRDSTPESVTVIFANAGLRKLSVRHVELRILSSGSDSASAYGTLPLFRGVEDVGEDAGVVCKNCGSPTHFASNAITERKDLGWCRACFEQFKRTFVDRATNERRWIDELRTVDGLLYSVRKSENLGAVPPLPGTGRRQGDRLNPVCPEASQSGGDGGVTVPETLKQPLEEGDGGPGGAVYAPTFSAANPRDEPPKATQEPLDISKASSVRTKVASDPVPSHAWPLWQKGIAEYRGGRAAQPTEAWRINKRSGTVDSDGNSVRVVESLGTDAHRPYPEAESRHSADDSEAAGSSEQSQTAPLRLGEPGIDEAKTQEEANGERVSPAVSKSVHPFLGLLIYLLPVFFVWMLLDKGYSTRARWIGFSWYFIYTYSLFHYLLFG